LNKMGSNLHALCSLVSEDVVEMDAKVIRTEACIGVMPLGTGFDDCRTVWEGLQLVNHVWKDAIGTLTPAQEAMLEALRQLEARLAHGVKNLEGACHLGQQKIDKDFRELQSALMEMATAIQMLGVEQERLTELFLQGNTSAGAGQTQQAILRELTTRMTLLEERLPSATSGRLGGDSFQSRVDVALFVENHILSNCFYLFHDVVTNMEALTTSHVECKDVLDEWYRSSKVGVNEASA